MTTTLQAPVYRTAAWIRPWYPAGNAGHIFPDCPDLLQVVSEPTEGVGWLDPHRGEVCSGCCKRYGVASWDAVCDTCDARMSEEWEDDADGPFDVEAANLWKNDHRCEPHVRVISPYEPKNGRKR